MPSRVELANAIRALSMDAVQRANSGHPGMPMGMADIAEVLWNDFLRHNPGNPEWTDRDRFVLSNGHGSMLLYSLLHLTGYDLPLAELERFRQLHSMTPGHPERGETPGVETTTGPLGQGFANAVGMAIAEKVLAARFNRNGHRVVDHHTWVFLGDGCLMEGISHEAASLAGTLGLGKLTALYDDNGISIDGPVAGWFTDRTPLRFEGYGWHVIPDVDGHDAAAVAHAFERARAEEGRPTLVCCKTVIGRGAPNKQGTEAVHGAPLGDEEIALARAEIGWPHPPFEIPGAVAAAWDARERGGRLEGEWNERFAAYRAEHPGLAAEYERRMAGELPAEWDAHCRAFVAATDRAGEDIASRKASQNALNGLGPVLPELIGGSADLAGSNLTVRQDSRPVGAGAGGPGDNYVYFGVREFGMSAIMNGMAAHGGVIPYGGTFLVFSDYARNAVRMAALMGLGSIFVYTHDSIGLGEDGPTHQAVEHAASLRLIPGMSLWRPCDAVESAVAWRAAVERRDGPTCLLFSRQSLPHQSRTPEQIENVARGGYVLVESAGAADVTLVATGSEVGLAVAAGEALAGAGVRARVVSMPSQDRFDAQDPAYRASVLPDDAGVRVAIEAGTTVGWERYVGDRGRVIGLDTFGASAPGPALFEHFGFTVENVVAVVRAALDGAADDLVAGASPG